MRTRALFVVFLLAAWLLPPASAYSAAGSAAFEAAESARQQLMADRKARQSRQSWQAVLDRYDQVIRVNLNSPQAALAMKITADLYVELYKTSRKSADLDLAVESYRRFIQKFPSHPQAAQAQLTIGRIYMDMKKDPDRAYVEWLKVELNHPQSTVEVAEARRLMSDLSKAAGVAPELTDIEAKTLAVAGPSPDKNGNSPDSNGVARIEGFRYWHNQTYSRIAVSVDRDVEYKDHILRPNPQSNQPMRLYLDIKKARLASGIQDTLPISDGLLSKARLAQYDPETVRVVLDIQEIGNYRIFSLSSPARIIIDVTGGKQTAPLPPTLEMKEPEKQELEKKEPDKKQPLTDLRETALKRQKMPRGPVTAPPDLASLARQLGLGIRRVVIDPGHGGKDRGASGLAGIVEKDLTLQVSRILAKRIRERLGLEAVLTRDEDVFLSLEERTAKANTLAADLFISVHANAHTTASVNGLETYILNIATDKEAMRVAAAENATSAKKMSDLQVILGDLMLNSKINESGALGNLVHRSMVSRLRQKYKNVKDLGVKQAPFYVLIGANMPSILVEVGFISNTAEADRLKNEKYLEALLDGVVDGIEAYKKSLEKTAPAGKAAQK